jgi:hypothetical protein
MPGAAFLRSSQQPAGNKRLLGYISCFQEESLK